MGSILPFTRANRAFLESVKKAESPSELEKLLGDDVERAETKLDNMIARFLDRRCSETELRECVEDLSTAELAKKNIRKLFEKEGE